MIASECLGILIVCFFKQKTAYEMRISDWSSDVCSSDLARWCPNFKETRTFDTRFYAVAAPAHGNELTVEAAEHSHIFWASARATLAMADRGQMSIIFPTRRNLERLAQADDFVAFSAHAAVYPIDLVTPWIETRRGAAHLCIPGHLGYPVTSEPFERVRRG